MVLYGRNGAGKTRLLTGLKAALTGVKQPGGRAFVMFRCTNPFLEIPDNGLDLVDVDPLCWTLRHQLVESATSHPLAQVGYTPLDQSSIAGTLKAIIAEHLDPDYAAIAAFTDELIAQSLFVAEAAGSASEPHCWQLWLGARADEAQPEVAADLTMTDELRRLEEALKAEAEGKKKEAGGVLSLDPHLAELVDRYLELPRAKLRPPNGKWYPDLPPWVPMPVVPIGLWSALDGFTVPTTDLAGLERRTLRAVLSAAGSLTTAPAQDGGFAVHGEVTHLLNELAAEANRQYDRLLLDAPTLACDLRPPEDWPERGAIQWTAVDRATLSTVPLTELSAAQAHWASVAVSAAISDAEFRFQNAIDEPGMWHEQVMLLDEPEAALHTLAQHHLARGLAKDAAHLYVIAATHSSALLGAPDSRLFHVARDETGSVQVNELPREVLDPLRAGDLGLDPTELLQLVRVFVVVEGAHDEAVINGLVADELRQLSARVLPLGGAVHAPGLVDSRVLFDFTDASVLVVLDNVDAALAGTCWERARDQASRGDTRSAVAELSPLQQATREMRWMYDFARRAIESKQEERIGLFGFAQKDILEYLPVTEFVPDANSWEELINQWGHRGTFKDFLRQEKGATLSVRRIKNVIQRLDHVPADIALVVPAVTALARARQRGHDA
jgi:energy-coupling factor transporter ATP-binding protein EcfA2